MGLGVEILWRLRARPRILAAVGVLLVAAGFGGGWAMARHVGAERVAYTSGPPPLPASPSPAPAPPAELQADLQDLIDRYREPVGVAITDVPTGWTAQIAGDEVYPQQSVSKLWVALAVLQAVDDGKMRLDQWAVMRPDDRSVFYQPLASRIRDPDGLAITLADLLRHALIESDNSANDKLIREMSGQLAVRRKLLDELAKLRSGANPVAGYDLNQLEQVNKELEQELQAFERKTELLRRDVEAARKK